MTPGEKIRHHRIRCHLSQEDLAARLSITRQAVAKWEAGRSNPSTENLIRIAEILNIPIEEIARADDTSFPPAKESESELPPSSPHPRRSLIRLLLPPLLYLAAALCLAIRHSSPTYFLDAFLLLINLTLLLIPIILIIMIIKALKKYLSQ